MNAQVEEPPADTSELEESLKDLRKTLERENLLLGEAEKSLEEFQAVIAPLDSKLQAKREEIEKIESENDKLSVHLTHLDLFLFTF